MSTAAKGQKPFATPRLVPRPTAASAARAARNATNRNLTSVASRQSPTRTPASPKLQGRTNVQRIHKSDSKSEVKIISNPEIELSEKKPPVEELQNFAIENTTGVIQEETPEKQDDYIAIITTVPEREIMTSGDLEPRSRPNTPLNNRPPTPQSAQSSRPQTPGVNSRPSTPAHPAQRQSTPSSRPYTPQRLSPILRPRTPSIVVPPSSRLLSPSSACSQPRSLKEDEDVRSVFLARNKEFQNMKMELDLKQQMVLEAFDRLRTLREQIIHEGGGLEYGEGPQVHELIVFNVADWTAEEIAQLCHDATAASTAEGSMDVIHNTLPIDESVVADLSAKTLSIPAHFADLCLQAFTARQEIIDWVKELIGQNAGGGGESIERIARYNSLGLELCESLRALKSRSDDTVEAANQLIKRVFRERSALVAVGESLIREIARLRYDMETHADAIKAFNSSQNEANRHRDYEEIRKELEEERGARISTTEKLRQARIRVNKMDRQLREADASIASLTSTVKNLEDQSRQKEAQLEARARKLRENLKTGEISSGHLIQQRDALQAEVQELKQQMETMTAQQKSMIQELSNQLKDSQAVLEGQHQLTQRVNEQKEAAEAALMDAQNNIEELTNKLSEVENRPNPDSPTEREMDLWAELQSTKDTLRIVEDEMTACKREKVRFLETLTKISGSESKVGMQQKLAAELLSKEEILGKMQIQIRELTKNIKLNEQKVIQYEQYIRNLQAQSRAVARNQEAPDGINYEDLQQEIMNLRIALLEAVHRNEELSEQLMQKDQQLEQQDKTSRAQARLIKVREELINMLKNKETEQSRELGALQQDLEHRMKIVDEVNKQIAAKADEIQELFKTLENKQQQIHRLEKIVLALEEQQRRAQAQRTRHEEKIAALEHELAANGCRKERRFLFF